MKHSNHLKIMLAVLAGFAILVALGVPVLANLPVLALVLACPLMMFFMMRGMNHGPSADRDEADQPVDVHRH